MDGVAKLSDGNRRALQDTILDYAIDLGRVSKDTLSESIEIRAWEPIRGVAQIDVQSQIPNIMAWYDLKTGTIDVVDLANPDTKNNSRIYNLPQGVIGDKYLVPEVEFKKTGLALDLKTKQEKFFQEYEYQGKKYTIRGLSLDQDIDFDGDKPVISPERIIEFKQQQEIGENIGRFMLMLPEGSKYISVTSENKFGSTMYNFESKGVPLTFSTVDGDRFYIWGKFGKKELYTRESFKLDDFDPELKIDVDALKEKFIPKKEEKSATHNSVSPKRESESAQKDDRPYNISISHMKEIKTVGSITRGWGRNYTGDIHDVMEAVVFAAKEARVNPRDLASFIEHESGFNPNRVSPTSAAGLGQFTTSTWNYVAFGISEGKFQGYAVERDGKKYNCLSKAYPEFDWGKGTENRGDIVLNALATAHYMGNNMKSKGTEDRNIGYISHNLGSGGCNQFLKKLEDSPDAKCSGDNLVRYNPVNYTNHGVPLTYRQAYHKIDGHLDNSYGMAVQRGFDSEFAADAINKGQGKLATEPVKSPTKAKNETSSISEDLKQQGMQPYTGTGFLPKEVMDMALAKVQAQSAGNTRSS